MLWGLKFGVNQQQVILLAHKDLILGRKPVNVNVSATQQQDMAIDSPKLIIEFSKIDSNSARILIDSKVFSPLSLSHVHSPSPNDILPFLLILNSSARLNRRNWELLIICCSREFPSSQIWGPLTELLWRANDSRKMSIKYS